jgi:hypothetical protein
MSMFNVSFNPMELYDEFTGQRESSGDAAKRYQQNFDTSHAESVRQFDTQLAYDKETRELNYQRSKEFAMNDLKWKIQAARDMGISPLAMMGGGSASGPTHISGVNPTGAPSPSPTQSSGEQAIRVGIQLAKNADKREQEKHDKQMDDLDKMVQHETEEKQVKSGMNAKSAYEVVDFSTKGYHLPEDHHLVLRQEVAESMDNMAAKLGAIGANTVVKRDTKLGPPGPWDDIPEKYQHETKKQKRERRKKSFWKKYNPSR